MTAGAIKSVVGGIFLITASLVSAQQPLKRSDSGVVSFAIGDDHFTMRVPDGYCVPEKKDLTRWDQSATADSQNLTPVTLVRCGDPGLDYILIKTPRATGKFSMKRSQFLNLIVEQFDNKTTVSEGFDLANRDVAKASDDAVSVANRDYGYAGFDDVCVYLSGWIIAQYESGQVQRRVTTCMTLVAQRNIALHLYTPQSSESSFEVLQSRVRDLAGSTELSLPPE